MLKQIVIVLTLTACGAPAYAAGGVYKWVDEQGNVQYRDRPPPTGAESGTGSYETLRKPPPPGQQAPDQQPPPGQKPEEAMKQLREKVQAVDKAQETEQKRKTEDKDLKELEARRLKSCNEAKRNLEVLDKSPNPIRIDEDGKRVILSDQERQAEIERNRKHVQLDCPKS